MIHQDNIKNKLRDYNFELLFYNPPLLEQMSENVKVLLNVKYPFHLIIELKDMYHRCNILQKM